MTTLNFALEIQMLVFMKSRQAVQPSSHLGRLSRVWIPAPVYFITTCTYRRLPILAHDDAFAITLEELATSARKYAWSVGRYVVMPDHLHFFCTAKSDADSKPLERFVGKFKEWSAKRLRHDLEIPAPIWQSEFFDHLLRTNESHAEKWLYVRENPVRAGLVEKAEDWRFAGELSDLSESL